MQFFHIRVGIRNIKSAFGLFGDLINKIHARGRGTNRPSGKKAHRRRFALKRNDKYIRRTLPVGTKRVKFPRPVKNHLAGQQFPLDFTRAAENALAVGKNQLPEIMRFTRRGKIFFELEIVDRHNTVNRNQIFDFVSEVFHGYSITQFSRFDK